MKSHRLAMVAIMLLAASACKLDMEQVGSSDTVPIHVVYRDQLCRDDTASIEPIRDMKSLADWWQPIARQQLPAKPLPQSLAALNFSESSVFVVSMGRQSSAGYDIELHEDRAPIQDASLTIPANFNKPSADMMTAQVMISPCVVVAVPAKRYETVAVRDRLGNTLLKVHL